MASRRKDLVWGMERRKGATNPNFKSGKYIDEKGYVRVLRPKHPHNNRGYCYEHRLVVEQRLGRYLETSEVIHHISEIKTDNRWENLFVTTISEHSAIHREGKRDGMVASKARRQTIRKKRKKSGGRRRGPDGKFI